MNLVAAFYTKKEQPLRMCFFLSFNGIATMVGALLAWGLGHATQSSLKPWRLIYLVIGLLNLVSGTIFYLFCPSTPADAKFLSEREKAIAVARVAHNLQGMKNKKYKHYQVIEALCDYKTWYYITVALGLGITNGGCTNFQSALLKGFGFSGISTTILQLPTGAFEWIFILVAGVLCVVIKNFRVIMLFISCIPETAGLIGIHVIPLKHKWALVGCTWLQERSPMDCISLFMPLEI
ncbi:unnamed protein product [Ambrosiozyma monospora]|uniref:Unnamed protein product n=1 Tax=Ambrosiozyma monospora TaxID=43982 RepID=A0ACB5U9T1_AMBMO|nr:unnamed protein product [Ambrosiozyma monospora]